ncbi:hypothetical protein KC19_3G242000 [Ceratodon purpureus]|uniref:C3HC-type domain-containing protein n=1 Tax=Ceratodon purpureus TaxID=3225 RepID=A0A8T0IPF7_CERPU|nr:hypothetical protein KC19_3G242000 [Ceratodon purpureus]
MEFTEVSEKRFERAMERLFSGSPTPASSSAGGPSPAKKKKEDQQNTSGLPLQIAGVVEPLLPSHGCRPWDRGDLLRRLATFKSISWFGKPQVAGPVACARRGWVNVDIDLLACETCGSRLSFPIPPSWPRDQVERAALTFAEQLDNAHKGLCTWKNNSCAETLAFFPPTSVADLRGAYNDRCETLLQLSALPVISETAKQQMKVSRGPQVDRLLSEPSPSDPEFLFENGVSSSSSRNGSLTMDKGFYQAQRMIAVCGWEPRLLPYSVDREDRSRPESSEHTGTSHGPGPSVTLHIKGDLQAGVTQSQIQPHVDVSDPASAVLDCNLCGASVGLWNFATVSRPAPLLDSGLKEILSPNKNHLESGGVTLVTDGVVADPDLTTTGAPDAPCSKAPEAPPVSPPKGVLDLRLTIAGGPRPTRLSAPVSVPPSFGTSHLLHTEVQPKKGDVANYDRSLPADNVEGILVHDKEQAEGGMFSRNSKRKRGEGSQWPGPMKQPVRDLPHASSVNAIDSSYLQKQENSMESVDNLPPDSDGQCANTAEYHGNGSKSLVQAEHNIFDDYDNGAVKSKSGGRVSVGGSSEAEINGVGTHLERAESVAEFGNVAELMDEFVLGRGLMDDFIPEEAEKVKDEHGGPLQAMLGISQTFINDSLSAGLDERHQGNGTQRETDDDAIAESTFDTTNAVIQGHDVDATLQVKEVTDRHISEESPVQRNEEAQSHPFFPPGLPLEDVRKLETQSGEFDPIRQHRHFCPWINGHVASATSGTSTGTLCGWQILLDALQHQHGVPGHVESELAASKHKDDALLSVRKFLGCVSSNLPPRT